jgi:hypothetical protein
MYDLRLPTVSPVSGEGTFSGGSFGLSVVQEATKTGTQERTWGSAIVGSNAKNYLYIPEKDILEHSKGLLTFMEQKETGFNRIYKDVLIAAQDIPTIKQSPMQKSIGQKITSIIDGYVEWVPSEGIFYMIKSNGNRIPFSYEASGYKKLGFLGLLVSCGQM